VQSERCRAAGLHTALWLVNGAWSRGEDASIRDRPVSDFAAKVLGRRTRKIGKKLDGLEDLAPPQRHKLRIATKKLRYATGFFASLFDDDRQTSRRKSFQDDLKTLQNALGTLNDIAMHRHIA
jgi:CHAD domain-containing protein